MNLKKLPPSMLMALGLGCVAEACLSPPIEPTESSTSGATGPDSNTVGPCLSAPMESTSTGTMGSGTSSGTGDSTAGMTTGPCLAPEPETDTEFGTDTDTGTGSDSGGSGTMGACLAPPGIAPDHDPSDVVMGSADAEGPAGDRKVAVERVLDRDLLPADVAERLRRIMESKR